MFVQMLLDVLGLVRTQHTHLHLPPSAPSFYAPRSTTRAW
jgi:hypothetical protein